MYIGVTIYMNTSNPNPAPLENYVTNDVIFFQTPMFTCTYDFTQYPKLGEYYSSDSIIRSDFTTDKIIVLPDIDTKFTYQNSTQNTRAASYSFYAKSGLFHSFYRQPNNLLQILSKIGGIFAFFKISAILSYCHRKQFEKQLQSQYDGDQLLKQPDRAYCSRA